VILGMFDTSQIVLETVGCFQVHIFAFGRSKFHARFTVCVFLLVCLCFSVCVCFWVYARAWVCVCTCVSAHEHVSLYHTEL